MVIFVGQTINCGDNAHNFSDCRMADLQEFFKKNLNILMLIVAILSHKNPINQGF
tara:strand:+ start:15 stop:179 length:165 start_codon:yes stop_codon:yes gene_type:complete